MGRSNIFKRGTWNSRQKKPSGVEGCGWVGGARKVRSRCPAHLARQVDVTTELANVAADYWAALGYTSQCL